MKASFSLLLGAAALLTLGASSQAQIERLNLNQMVQRTDDGGQHWTTLSSPVASELVTYATGPDVQATGPRVKEFRGEEALLTAFLQVVDPTEITVCNTQGHGEPPFDDLHMRRGARAGLGNK